MSQVILSCICRCANDIALVLQEIKSLHSNHEAIQTTFLSHRTEDEEIISSSLIVRDLNYLHLYDAMCGQLKNGLNQCEIQVVYILVETMHTTNGVGEEDIDR